MKTNDKVDAARVDLFLSELRLSGVKLVLSALASLRRFLSARSGQTATLHRGRIDAHP